MSNCVPENLLELLACPVCDVQSDLEVSRANNEQRLHWTKALREQEPIEEQITCHTCVRQYPITCDGIPVMWSDTLRNTFDNLEAAPTREKPTESDVKAANIQVYEHVIEDYHATGIHADATTTHRFRSAISQQPASSLRQHLDIGCGGGNVLAMLAKQGGTNSVGMDISLAGLRIVRRRGYLAVLGDAELIPFRSGSFDLVTASSVLHHLYKPTQLITGAFQVLRPGGKLLTDFDPNQAAAAWGWLPRQLYAFRQPVFRIVSRLTGKVLHSNSKVQLWNEIAEFHNRPGAGFSPEDMTDGLRSAGFTSVQIFAHNRRDSRINSSRFAKPTLRHFIAQTLSGRNPFLRKFADTLMTVSTTKAA